MVNKPAENIFLSGNWGPVSTEHTHDPVKIISGTIPKSLYDGMYIRNGPNPLDTIDPKTYHIFDGNGMLQGVYFRNGNPTFINRYVRTKKLAVQEQMNMGYPNFVGMALSTNLLRLAKFMVIRGLISLTTYKSFESNTSVTFHDRRLLTLHEAEGPKHVDVPDLETMGDYNFTNDEFAQGPVRAIMSAHPKTCPKTGNMYFFGYNLEAAPHVAYSVATADGKLKVNKKPIPACNRPVAMHDFAISEHWAIFLDYPLILNPAKNLRAGKPVMSFDPSEKTRFHFVDRETGGNKCTMSFETEPLVIIHTAHAYESPDGNSVVLIACMAHDIQLGQDMNAAEVKTFLTEFRFNLVRGSCTISRLYEEPVEFPVIDNSLATDPSVQFIYGALTETNLKMPLFKGLFKYDIESRKTLTYKYEPSYFGGEPYFVKRHKAKSEDDGYLLAYVSKNSSDPNNHARLLILDAKTLQEECVLEVPSRIPFGFHGTWLSKEQIASQVRSGKKESQQALGWWDWAVYTAINIVNKL